MGNMKPYTKPNGRKAKKENMPKRLEDSSEHEQNHWACVHRSDRSFPIIFVVDKHALNYNIRPSVRLIQNWRLPMAFTNHINTEYYYYNTQSRTFSTNAWLALWKLSVRIEHIFVVCSKSKILHVNWESCVYNVLNIILHAIFLIVSHLRFTDKMRERLQSQFLSTAQEIPQNSQQKNSHGLYRSVVPMKKWKV